MAKRQPVLLVAIGRKGVGKTHRTKETIKFYSGGGQTNFEKRKALFFDVNNEYSEIRAIPIGKVKAFAAQTKIEAARVRAYKLDPVKNYHVRMSLDEMAEALDEIMDNFRGGAIIIEDMTLYVGDTPKKDIIGKICTGRHADTDIFIHFQTIGKLKNPKIFGNTNMVRLHKQDDPISRHKNQFGEFYQPLCIADILVSARYDKATDWFLPYKQKFTSGKMSEAEFNDYDKKYKIASSFCVWVSKDTNTIEGNFTREEFLHAIDEYVALEYQNLIKPMLNKVNLQTGQKIYDTVSAIHAKREELFKKHWGN